jgi:hypothetical protein
MRACIWCAVWNGALWAKYVMISLRAGRLLYCQNVPQRQRVRVCNYEFFVAEFTDMELERAVKRSPMKKLVITVYNIGGIRLIIIINFRKSSLNGSDKKRKSPLKGSGKKNE